MKPTRTALFAAAIGVASFVASAAGWSLLQPGIAAPVAPAAADQGRGMALMSAVVTGGGALVRGTGVVSAALSSNGVYKVLFERSLADCTFSATPGTVSPQLTPFYGVFATANHYPDETNSVRVMVAGTNDVLTSASFHLLVFCHR